MDSPGDRSGSILLKNVIQVPSFSEMLGIQDSVWEHFLMMGAKGGDQDRLFYSFNLDKYVPADHLLRRIDRFPRSQRARESPGDGWDIL